MAKKQQLQKQKAVLSTLVTKKQKTVKNLIKNKNTPKRKKNKLISNKSINNKKEILEISKTNNFNESKIG